MKKALIFVLFTLASFSSLADTNKQWGYFGDIPITLGTSLENSKVFARAQLFLNPENKADAQDTSAQVMFTIATPKYVEQCKKNPEMSFIKQVVEKVNGRAVSFYLFCFRIQFDQWVDPTIHINYAASEDKDNAILREMFFISNEVDFIGFKFPAKNFTNLYKKLINKQNL